MSTTWVPLLQEVRKGDLSPSNWIYRWVWAAMWVLGLESLQKQKVHFRHPRLNFKNIPLLSSNVTYFSNRFEYNNNIFRRDGMPEPGTRPQLNSYSWILKTLDSATKMFACLMLHNAWQLKYGKWKCKKQIITRSKVPDSEKHQMFFLTCRNRLKVACVWTRTLMCLCL